MEAIVEDIVIVGAGIAGLTTSLGLHRYQFTIFLVLMEFCILILDERVNRGFHICRLGIPSLVLESSNTLRVNGFAVTTLTNAWRSLDAVGVGDILRQQHVPWVGLFSSLLHSSKSTNLYLSFVT